MHITRALALLSFALAAPACAPPDRGAAVDAGALQTLAAVEAEAQEEAREEARVAAAIPAAAERLRGPLSPIDSPLPDRATLEGLVDDPAAVLTALLKDGEAVVRQNAARCLGLFGDVDGVPARLLALVGEAARGPAERTAAAEGLGRMPLDVRAGHVEQLGALLRDSEPAVAFAAVSALSGVAEASTALEAVAADGTAHPAVRRRIRRELDAR